MRGLFEAAGTAHELHLLEARCGVQYANGRAKGSRRLGQRHRLPPHPSEAFNVIRQAGG
jgi:hypothetical protein